MARDHSAIAVALAVALAGVLAVAATPAMGDTTTTDARTTAVDASEGPAALGATVGASDVTADASDVSGATADAPRGTVCDYERLYNRTIGSVVQVRTGAGLGSGFVFRRFASNGTGYVVTNEHVVGDSATVAVRFSRGQIRRGTVLGATALTDLAVVRVANVPGYADALPLASTPPHPGQRVAAFGSPFGLERTITSGIVSGVNREMPTERGFTIPNTIQTDAPINPGNSGGPLVRCPGGEVIGVNRAGGAENIGFAVPASIIERVVPALVARGEVEYPFLGVQLAEVTPAIARANDLDTPRGLMVVDTVEGTPAGRTLQGATRIVNASGQRVPVGGDVIVAVDGNTVRTREDLVGYLLTETNPGETVRVTILRDGERRTVEVTLAERPGSDPGPA